MNDDKRPSLGQTVVDICPNADGAKDWQPSAYSPRTKLIYVPHQHLCMNWKTSDVGYIAGTPYVGATVDMYAGPGGYRGEFMAWDPVARKKVWAIHENLPVWSGAVVTGGDVAFYGTMDRWFKAVDAKTGKVLWQIRTPSGIIGQPVTYAVNGVQYVAILCGIGGWPGAVANAVIDPRVRNGALGFTGATQDLPAYTAAGSTLLVFALPAADRSAAQNQSTAPSPPAPNPGAEPPHPATRSQAMAAASKSAVALVSAAACTGLLAAFAIGPGFAGPQSAGALEATTFRVCADPNNLPFSNAASAGFENKLAELFAAELNEPCRLRLACATARLYPRDPQSARMRRGHGPARPL